MRDCSDNLLDVKQHTSKFKKGRKKSYLFGNSPLYKSIQRSMPLNLWCDEVIFYSIPTVGHFNIIILLKLRGFSLKMPFVTKCSINHLLVNFIITILEVDTKILNLPNVRLWVVWVSHINLCFQENQFFRW